MSSILDETLVRPPAEETPFAYGDRTVLQMQSQQFDVREDLGTMMVRPDEAAAAIPRQTVAVPQEDPIARLERKLDLALIQLEKLQQRIESIDLTLVRVLSR